MKNFLFIFTLLLVISCKTKEGVEPTLTLEEAMAQQSIIYDFEDRHYHLTANLKS